MFGGPKNNASPPPRNTDRPQAGDVARITNSVTHVFVDGQSADSINVYYNGQQLMTGLLESISVEIIAPDDKSEGTLTAILSYYEAGADGSKTNKSLSLFPGTLELLADGKRLTVAGVAEGSFDGLILRFGTENDGVGLEANGVKSLRLLITPELRDVRLVWVEDNREDVILS